mmetsp:Transcript_16173/g.45066  ORF Transcript_16173/g.45066 Transcript_16173/m.45066 type:complete len:648 (-) Transcript_16173:208-2151(-)|eukprot:CAMPEP_0117654342 /NCGR_PEP_ID=MMETSP0804-20121206/3693_1 /TAXON_ID=1074897 /ORGANISM="Tetraselmis astigmatica, Strain CCMP880" /LENGTH=647 /DNA_ID=CAMNT_0005460617 /DNA_START=247 /DNA_END=2193 /DNA_ORIENTATION=+
MRPRQGHLPTLASKLGARPALADGGDKCSQTLTIRQVLSFLALLLLGMFVAMIFETSHGSTQAAAAGKTSLYTVLAPKATRPAPTKLLEVESRRSMAQPQGKAAVLQEPGPATAETKEGTPPNISSNSQDGAASNQEAGRQPAEASTLARIRRTPPDNLWEGIRKVERCDNSCESAKNGRCEDGRNQSPWPEASSPVRCDIGTDCDDCGPFTGDMTQSLRAAAESGHMVKELLAEGTEVLIRGSSVPPGFSFAYTNPRHDVDVSSHMHHSGVIERDMTFVWYKILKEKCLSGGVVADVGGNFGWYTVLAASLGCRVVTWEPVPRFRAFLLYNILVNGLGHLVEVRDCVVSNNPTPPPVIVPQRGIWGTAGVGGMNIDSAIDNEGEYLQVQTRPERLDDIVREKALLLKVDVEGYEPEVFRSAARLIKDRVFDHIFLEYSPGVADRAQNYTFGLEFPTMLMALIEAGYNIRSFDTPGLDVPLAANFDRHPDFPKMERVTRDNLKYDIMDMQNAIKSQGRFGCAYMPAKVQKLQHYMGCSAIPEGFYPKSFHSVISHNANIWAAHSDVDTFPSGPVTGVIRPDLDERRYFATREGPGDGLKGMGSRVCKHLSPQVQLQHRCRCTDAAICGHNEKIILEEYAKAKLPFQT